MSGFWRSGIGFLGRVANIMCKIVNLIDFIASRKWQAHA